LLLIALIRVALVRVLLIWWVSVVGLIVLVVVGHRKAVDGRRESETKIPNVDRCKLDVGN